MPAFAQAGCAKYSHPNPKATFDLNGLAKQGGYFARDTYVNSGRPFDYYFNLCGETPQPDKNCEAWDALGDIVAYQFENVSEAAPEGKCWALGAQKDPVYKLLDDTNNNAAVGVRITFDGGSECRKDEATPRKFAVNVRCVKEKTSLNFLSTVSEDLENGCEYEVDIFSIHGCPTECHSTTHEKLCSGHGVCGIDSEAQKARCFCNTDWDGPDCAEEKKAKSGPSSTKVNTILLFLVFVLLAGFFILSFFLYGKIKALNADDVRYNALDTDAGANM